MRSLRGRVALVTGAANGIGRTLATLLAQNGAMVFAADRDVVGLAELKKELAANDFQIETHELDVLSEDSVNTLVKSIVDKMERIDILANLVGGSTVGKAHHAPLDKMPLEDWKALLDFNLTGTFLCTRAVIPYMKEKGFGRILNCSSMAARGDSKLTNAAYAVAKSGIEALTKKLALDLGPFGITCNAIAPGITLSPRVQEKFWEVRTEEQRQAIIEDIPARRPGTPEDQANTLLFLASEEASYVSGQVIRVAGGR